QCLNLHREDRGQISNNRSPRVSCVRGPIDLSTSCAEVNAAFVERIDRHRIPQHIYIAVGLRKTLRKRLPIIAASPAPGYRQLAVKREMLRIALDGNYVNRLRLVCVNVDHKAEVGR